VYTPKKDNKQNWKKEKHSLKDIFLKGKVHKAGT
jgi:hypothetical protein